jgi:hypothetical protein
MNFIVNILLIFQLKNVKTKVVQKTAPHFAKKVSSLSITNLLHFCQGIRYFLGEKSINGIEP